MTKEESSQFVAVVLQPTLQPALVALCREKPKDPVTWLAHWLLEHKPPPPAFSVTEAFANAAAQVFALADADGSGQLDYSEVNEIASNDAEAKAILGHLDQNQDGQISLDEWMSFFMMVFDKARPIAEMLLEKAVRLIFMREFEGLAMTLFYEFDSDRSGVLEMREVMMAVGDDGQAKAFLKHIDADEDTTVSLQEWMVYFMGFWRHDPQRARATLGYLMQRVAELRMMPAPPPPPPA